MFTTYQPDSLFDLALDRQRELHRQAQQERLRAAMQPDRSSLTLFSGLLQPLRRTPKQPKRAMLPPVAAG